MYYIFDKTGTNIAKCNAAVNADDLASRGETAVASDEIYTHPIRLEDGQIIQILPMPPSADELKKQQQDEIWQAIKAKRDANAKGGVYIKSVDKWFATDETSRSRYLSLQLLDNFPDDLQYKTMDNSFVLLTRKLVGEINLAIIKNEQADFATAEKHKAAMLKADDPAGYDYSTGWVEVFVEQDKGK